MKTIDKSVIAHLFICCRNRQDKPSCAQKDAEILFSNLKKWTKTNNLNEHIKISKSSCLGHCEDGITACLYPQNQWLTQISLDDEDQLKEILIKARQNP